jgi:hypothetical protein
MYDGKRQECEGTGKQWNLSTADQKLLHKGEQIACHDRKKDGLYRIDRRNVPRWPTPAHRQQHRTP